MMAKVAKVNMSLYVSKKTRAVIEEMAERLEIPMSVAVEMMVKHYVTGTRRVIAASGPDGASDTAQ